VKRAALLATFVLVLPALRAADGASAPATNTLRQVTLDRVHGSAVADVRSAYQSRAKIVENRPVETVLARINYDTGPFGRVGFWHWHVSSLTDQRQDVHRRAFNEMDYGVNWLYTYAFSDDCRLVTDVLYDWITLQGYKPAYRDRKSDATIVETRLEQALENPWITPFYRLRRAYHPNDWFYARTGVRHSFQLPWDLTLTPSWFLEYGNENHFQNRYGAAEDGGKYRSGLQASVFNLALAWCATKSLSFFVAVEQFDVLHDEARDTIKAGSNTSSRRDLTMAQAGLRVSF